MTFSVMIFLCIQWWNTSNSHKMKENTHHAKLMTKNRKTMLVDSSATGPWFCVGTTACYWGLSACPSKNNKKIPLRSSPPGFVSDFTLSHAICCWCQISGTSGARLTPRPSWTLENIWKGTEHPGLGRQVGLWHGPTAPWCPMCNTAVSITCKSNQSLLHPPQYTCLGGQFEWLKKPEALPITGDCLSGQGDATPQTAATHASPPGCREPCLDLSHPLQQGWEGSLRECMTACESR